MVRVLYRVFALVGFLVLVSAAAGGYLAYQAFYAVPELPGSIVLSVDLDQDVVEESPDDPVAGTLAGGAASLRDAVDALDRGAHDPRVKGALIRLGSDGMGMGQVQEVRAALARFRAAGKFTTAYAESFGEFGPGNKSYYLASACEQIWLQPIGMLGLTGLSAEMPFARKGLDQLHIQPEIEHREEYKSAMETFTERSITAPHREMLESLLDDLTDQIVGGVAAGRKLEAATVRHLIDTGPFIDHEAKDAGLIDRIGYYDELVDEALERAGPDAGITSSDDYLNAADDPNDQGPTVALIFAVGGIERGEGGVNPMLGGTTMGSDAIVSAFQQAIDDDDVRAILLRIDSPGGTVGDSQEIHSAIGRLRIHAGC